ncbi:MAG: Cd(II)/Pb(II)-responsive transcriptional regulator [Burkholderiaceae bacterium]
MKIGELARLTSTQTETIRFYEREKLMPSASRSSANYRVYNDEHAQRLSFIRHCRNLDMTLNEIRTLLHFKDNPQEDCDGVNSLLEEHIGHVEQRIRDLRRLRKDLGELRDRCDDARAAADCGILDGLNKAARQNPKVPTASAGHIPGTHRPGHRTSSRSTVTSSDKRAAK